MTLIKKALAHLGLIGLLSTSPSCIPQQEKPRVILSEEDVKELEDKINCLVLEPQRVEEPQKEKEKTSFLQKDTSQIDLSFSLRASYDLPLDYTFDFLDGLHKKKSTWHWNPYSGEFYYGEPAIPLKATFEPLQGLNTNYQDFITLDHVPLRSYMSVSEEELKKTWQESVAEIKGGLEQIFIPEYVSPFVERFNDYLAKKLRQYQVNGEIPLEKYLAFLSDLWEFGKNFYTHQVLPDDRHDAQQLVQAFIDRWEAVFPFLDSDAIFQNPQERLAIGGTPLKDWVTLLQGGGELLQTDITSDTLHAYANFVGRGKGEADTLLRLRFPGGIFLQDFRVLGWLYAQGEVDIFLHTSPGASPFELAGIADLFPDYDQSVRLPNLTLKGEATYALQKLVTARNQYAFVFFEPSLEGGIFGFGITNTLKFGKNESGTLSATAALDTSQLILSGAFAQQWIKDQWQSHASGLYFFKEGWQKNLWYSALSGVQAEATKGLREQKETIFSGSLSVENSYESSFSQKKEVTPYYHPFDSSGYANLAFGIILPPKVFSPEPFFLYAMSPEPRLTVGSLFAFPDQIPVVGIVSYGRYLRETDEMKYGFVPEEEVELQGFFTLDENREKVKEYFRELQRSAVHEAGDALIERKTADLYSYLNAPSVVLSTKNGKLEVQAIFSDATDFFIAAGYELGLLEENTFVKAVLGNNQYQLRAGYGMHTPEKFQGREYELAFNAALGENSSLLLRVQPLQPLYGEEAFFFETREKLMPSEAPNDFRAMVTVEGRF